MENKHSLSEKEATLILEDFEDRTNIFSFAVHGVSVWQVMRFHIAGRLQKLKWQKSTINKTELFISLFRGLQFWKLIPLWKKRYFVSSPYSGLRSKQNGLYEDVWFDDLLSSVDEGGKLVRLNAAGFSNRLSLMKTPYSYDTTIIFYIAAILARFFPIERNSKVYQGVSELTIKHLGLNQITPRMVEKYFSNFLWQSRLFRMLILSRKTKAVIVVDTGELGLMHACREMKISFIEMQHGVFSKYHPRSLRLNELRNDQNLLWPSTFAVYGTYWEKELERTALGEKGLVRVVGNSQVERYRLMRKKTKINKPNIVVTTQALEQLDLTRFFKTFLHKSSLDFTITFKLHPAFDMRSQEYKELASFDSRVKIVSGLEEPNTFKLIALSDFHISVGSACHYDSLAIGTPSLVLKLEGYELMDPLISAGYVRLISTSEELDLLLKDFSESTIPNQMAKTEDICTYGFCENMRCLIKSN